MNIESIERLYLKNGEQPTAAHLQALQAAIARRTPVAGVGVRRRILPWGTHEHFETGGGGGSATSSIFEPDVSTAGDSFTVTWQRGLIEGVEPAIGGNDEAGIPISKGAVYTIPRSLAAETGEILVYFRSFYNEGWIVQRIRPFAASATPPQTPWTSDKLALIILPDGSFWRALVSNQGHIALNRKSSGLAQHEYWGKF